MPFPLGLPVGHPGNAEEQRAVLDLAFSTLDYESGPVLIDYHDPSATIEAGSPLQASGVEVNADAETADLATELTLMRQAWQRRVQRTGRTGVGLARITPERWADIASFLQDFARDPTTADSCWRPIETPSLVFLRHCVEDLRVLYAEARLETKPDESSDDRQRWLLGSTAFGLTLRRLRDAMKNSSTTR